MKRSLALFAVCLWLSASAFAASVESTDAFVGYQYTRSEGVNLNGWNGAVTANFTKQIGITADFSGAYKSIGGASFKMHTYTFGPVISAPDNGPFVPYAHILFGGFNDSPGPNGFAMIVGAGADAKVSDRLRIRLGQFDWMSLHANGSSSNKNFRYSGGLIIHF